MTDSKTELCAELRLMARLVRDYDYDEIRRMLRDAADTIESLRERLHGETIGAGECEVSDFKRVWQSCNVWTFELSCGHSVQRLSVEPPALCEVCGKAVQE